MLCREKRKGKVFREDRRLCERRREGGGETWRPLGDQGEIWISGLRKRAAERCGDEG